MSYVKTVNARAVHLTADALRMTASAASLARLIAVLLYDHVRFPLQRPDHQCACYLRLIRPDLPFLHDEESAFPLGGHRLVEAQA